MNWIIIGYKPNVSKCVPGFIFTTIISLGALKIFRDINNTKWLKIYRTINIQRSQY